MTTGALSHRPLAQLPDLGKPTGSSAPPEPPTAVFSGPVFEQRDGKHFCKVPGCSKPTKPFIQKHAIAIHVSRRHGLTLQGKPAKTSSGTRPPPTKDPEPDWRSINVRDVMTGNNLALIMQAIRILDTTRENLTGKLNEMELLKRKSAKLDVIVGYLRELLPAPAAPQQQP